MYIYIAISCANIVLKLLDILIMKPEYYGIPCKTKTSKYSRTISSISINFKLKYQVQMLSIEQKYQVQFALKKISKVQSL